VARPNEFAYSETFIQPHLIECTAHELRHCTAGGLPMQRERCASGFQSTQLSGQRGVSRGISPAYGGSSKLTFETEALGDGF